jgi:hypothetical protein
MVGGAMSQKDAPAMIPQIIPRGTNTNPVFDNLSTSASNPLEKFQAVYKLNKLQSLEEHLQQCRLSIHSIFAT